MRLQKMSEFRCKNILISALLVLAVHSYAACPGAGDKVTIDDLGFKLHGAQGACSNDYTAEYELKVDQREILSDAVYTFTFTDGTDPSAYTASQLKASGGIIEHTFTKPSCSEPRGYFSAKVEVTCNSKYYGSASIENVKVLLPPQAKFSAKSKVCEGENISFSNQSIAGLDWECNKVVYSQWDFGDGTTSTSNSPTHAYSKAGTYTVLLTVNSDKDIECTFDEYSLDITVVDLPVINTISPDPIEVCAGKQSGAISVSGSNIAYIFWTGGSSAGLSDEKYNKDKTSIPSFIAKNNTTKTTETTVTVTPYNSLGCQGEPKTFIIKVKPSPSINPISNISACAGETVSSINFSSPISGTQFTWVSDKNVGFGINGSGNIQSFTALNNGNTPVTATVTVTATNSDPALSECGAVTSQFNVTVNPIPSPSSIIGSNPTKCGTNDGKIIIAGLAPGITYSVTLSSKIQYKSDTNGNIIIANLAPGTYSNIKISLGNCDYVHSESVTLSAPAAPETPVISVSQNEICEGSGFTLSSNAPDGVHYHWSGPSGWSSTEKSPAISNVTQSKHSGEYSLYVSKNACNSGIATKSITIKKDPEVSVSLPSHSCVGRSIKTENNVTYNWNIIPESDKHVEWSVTPSSFEYIENTSATSLYPVIKFNANTEYTVKVKVTTIGCQGAKLESSGKISVLNGDFTLDVKADKTAGCVPFIVSITNNTDEKAGIDDYTWSVDPADVTISDAKDKAPSFTFNNPGDYKIKVIAKNFCGPQETSINIESHKNISISLENISGVCGSYIYKTSELLTLTGDEKDISAIEWKLDNEDGVTFSEGGKTDLRPTINFSKSGTYNLTLNIKTYCGEQSATANIVIDEPIAKINIEAVSALCANVKSEQGKNPYSLKATPEGGVWSCQSHPDWVENSNFYPNAPGNVLVKYLITKGSCSAEESVTIQIKDYPEIKIGDNIAVCLNDVTPIKLEATPSGGVWSGEHVSKSGDDYIFTPPLEIGTWNLNYVGVEQSSGCKTESDKSATVQGLPNPSFGPDHHCLPGETIFEPVADAGNKFYYSYGDGTSDMTGCHLYVSIGTYDVKLVVEAGTGCRDSLTQSLLVEQAPTPTFQLDKHNGCSDLSVLITPSVTTSDPDVKYLWDFGPKGTSTLLDPGTVVFTATAFDSTYTITFSVDNICGSSSYYDTVRVYAKAGAAFDTEQEWFCSPVDVYFQNKTLGSMESVSYLWDFGDGATSTERFPTHRFETGFMEAKNFDVKLTATNKCGSDNVMHQVYVKPQNIKAQFANPSNYNCVGSEVCFVNNSIGMCETEPISRVVWDFGNGLTSEEWNGCTKYTKEGSYMVKLTINNVCGMDSYESEVHIYPSPKLTIHSTSFLCQLDTISPTFVTNEPLSSHIWSFGNGDKSYERAPDYVYKTPGVYTLKLTIVADNAGHCAASDSLLVDIKPLPDPLILNQERDTCGPFDYTPVYSKQYYTKVDYEGSGTPVAMESHTYQNHTLEPVVYYPKFYFEDSYGCKSSQVGIVKIYPQPEAKISIGKVEKEMPEVVYLKNESLGADKCKWILPYSGECVTCSDTIEKFYNNDTKEIVLKVSNAYGCLDSCSISHSPLMKGLYFPNTFSPNGVIEEVKTFNGIGIGLQEYELQIFDMYGNMIYRTTSLDAEGKPNEGWDGRDKSGKMMPQDVYTWIAKAIYIDGSAYPYGNSKGTSNETLHRGSVLLLQK